MAVKKHNVRIWITVHEDTKKTIELLLPLLKAHSMGEVIDRAVVSYALAVLEYTAAKSSKKGKAGKKDEKIN